MVLGTLAAVLNGAVHPVFSIIFAKIVTVSKDNLLIFLTILNKTQRKRTEPLYFDLVMGKLGFAVCHP